MAKPDLIAEIKREITHCGEPIGLKQCSEHHYQLRSIEGDLLVDIWPGRAKFKRADLRAKAKAETGSAKGIIQAAVEVYTKRELNSGNTTSRRAKEALDRSPIDEPRFVDTASRGPHLVENHCSEFESECVCKSQLPDGDAIRAMILAEYRYWRDADDQDDDTLSAMIMGATGALSNVIARAHGLEVKGASDAGNR